MISYKEILMGRDVDYPLTELLERNLEKLYIAVNKLRTAYGKPMNVTSGYRPGHYNKAAGGAKKSSHLTCEAVDFADGDGALARWCLSNLNVLQESGLWMESPAHTKGWLHVQIRPVPGKRVFEP